MHKGFELFLSEDISPIFCKKLFENYYPNEKQIFDSTNQRIERVISNFKSFSGNIDGTKMQANWFPQIRADIFLSHSHNDKDLAIAIAGWLRQEFGLKTFIDSCIWGHSKDLLKLIDNEFCSNKINNKIISYNYENRNYSTSHVHMMLSSALTNMIDNTECVIFLNTPNSITPEDVINKTFSPWIYTEILMTSLIRLKRIEEYRPKITTESFSAIERRKELKVEYVINTDHLAKMSTRTLLDWKKGWPIDKPHLDFKYFALDKLYELTKNQ
ncbi:MAG: hypothetical protein WCL70_01410 [Paludibacter sp.]